MSSQSKLSFNLMSSSLIIKLNNSDVSDKLEVSENIKSYLGLIPNHELDEYTISLLVTDITQLGSLVNDILAILNASSIDVILDENIQSALFNA